jgi:hypothetical protein
MDFQVLMVELGLQETQDLEVPQEQEVHQVPPGPLVDLVLGESQELRVLTERTVLMEMMVVQEEMVFLVHPELQ